jgi:hypothetical protein
MWKLAVFALALSATAAVADDAPATRRAPPPATCKVDAPVVFTIDHRVDPGSNLDTSQVTLRDSGAWSRTVTSGGKAGTPTAGCLPKATNDEVTALLKAAPWTVTHRRITCKARSVSYAVCSVNGKEVYTQKVCGADALDAKSQAAVDRISELVDQKP